MPEPLFDPSQMDLVTETSDAVIDLIIVQTNRWTGTDAQLESLQEKVHNYVSFAIDGPLLEHFPATAGKAWRIVVDCQNGQPDARTSRVLDELATRLPAYGGSLLVRSV